MELKKEDIRGVQVCNTTLEDAVEYIQQQMQQDAATAVYTPNAEIIQLCIDDPAYYPIINSAELIVPDGVGVIKAARILGTPLQEKVAGVVLGERVLQLAAEKNYPVFLFGGKDVSRCPSGQSIADQCKDVMEKKYPGLNICGTKDGYCKKEGPENEQFVRLHIHVSRQGNEMQHLL